MINGLAFTKEPTLWINRINQIIVYPLLPLKNYTTQHTQGQYKGCSEKILYCHIMLSNEVIGWFLSNHSNFTSSKRHLYVYCGWSEHWLGCSWNWLRLRHVELIHHFPVGPIPSSLLSIEFYLWRNVNLEPVKILNSFLNPNVLTIQN